MSHAFGCVQKHPYIPSSKCQQPCPEIPLSRCLRDSPGVPDRKMSLLRPTEPGNERWKESRRLEVEGTGIGDSYKVAGEAPLLLDVSDVG